MILEGIYLIGAIFLGIISGYFLSLIAPEEIKPGISYLILFRNIVFNVFIAVFSFYFINNIFGLLAGIILSSIIAVFSYWLVVEKGFFKPMFLVSSFPLIFIYSDKSYLMVCSVLLFLSGMAWASILAYDYIKKENISQKFTYFKFVLKSSFLFFFAGILPFFFSNL